LDQFGHRPELSQANGMTLVRCILDKLLGVVCHCFPLCLDIPTFATRCLHVHHDVRDPSSGRWDCGRECCPVILPKWLLPRHLGIFYMPQIYDMGPTAYFPSKERGAENFFALKNPTASAGFEPANLGTKRQHATPRPPKPLGKTYKFKTPCKMTVMYKQILKLLQISSYNDVYHYSSCVPPLPANIYLQLSSILKWIMSL